MAHMRLGENPLQRRTIVAPKKTAKTKTPTSLPAAPTRELARTPARPAAGRRRAEAAAAPVAQPRKTAPARRVAKAKATSPVATEPVSPAASPRTVTNEDIQVRAYFLALEHGGHGGNLDFWLLAERELRGGAASHD